MRVWHRTNGRTAALALFAALVGAVWVGVAAAAAAALAGPVGDAWDSCAGSLATPDERLAGGVVLASALLLSALWLWLTACLLVEVLDQAGGWLPRWASRPIVRSWRPSAIRSVVALVLGSAVAVPLHADAGEPPVLPSALDGLPLPDRIAARDLPGPLTVRVQVGDTLWGIAAARLPPGAAPSVVDQGWRRIYRHNRSAVGPDPDLLTPGMRLRVPRRR